MDNSLPVYVCSSSQQYISTLYLTGAQRQGDELANLIHLTADMEAGKIETQAGVCQVVEVLTSQCGLARSLPAHIAAVVSLQEDTWETVVVWVYARKFL